MLTHPLPDLAAWTAWFSDAPIPVLAATAEELELLERVEAMRGDVDAHQLVEPVRHDPLMSLRLLATVAQLRRQRGSGDSGGPETVTAALVMMGIGPFFGAFSGLPQVEVQLASQPEALAGLQRVIRRAHRAANFSVAFAVHRMDGDAEVLQLVALLHDFAEMLLWCHAPALALEIARRQQADPSLRSELAQRQLLNIDLLTLQQALMHAWALPDLLVRIADDSQAAQPQVQNVVLAIRLARHTEDPLRGWQNPAVPDDLAAIAQLLNLSPGAAEALVHSIDG
ncbi:HDOD domain-containing protein [Methylibium sp.]|uniref:HDOD domain-containing protein n=1 Tax=Methylibium sp. TaxID=2067992 RepID=UPI003D09C38D